MATRKVTIDTNEWIYPDMSGVEHTVTNAETFTFTLTDGGIALVDYVPIAGQEVATDDGYKLVFRPDDLHSFWGPMADADQGTDVIGPTAVMGDWVISDPVSHVPTRWHVATYDVDNVDLPTVFTNVVFEREDNPMYTFTWTTVTVGAP